MPHHEGIRPGDIIVSVSNGLYQPEYAFSIVEESADAQLLLYRHGAEHRGAPLVHKPSFFIERLRSGDFVLLTPCTDGIIRNGDCIVFLKNNAQYLYTAWQITNVQDSHVSIVDLACGSPGWISQQTILRLTIYARVADHYRAIEAGEV